MNAEAIRRDYTRQLLQHLQEDLNRRLNAATAVFDMPEIALILAEVSASLVLGSQVFVATHAKDSADVEDLLNSLEAALSIQLAGNRTKVLRTAAAIRRVEKVEQAL